MPEILIHTIQVDVEADCETKEEEQRVRSITLDQYTETLDIVLVIAFQLLRDYGCLGFEIARNMGVEEEKLEILKDGEFWQMVSFGSR